MKDNIMKKKYIFLGALAVLCVVGYFLTPSLESVVRGVVHKYGSQVTGTDVNLKGFSLSLTNGQGAIKGLTVANPANYKSANLIDLGGVSVKVNLKSLTTDTIIIDEILVDKPVITYEMLSLTQNNIKQLQENIAKNTASAEKAEKKDNAAAKSSATDKSAAKKVIIKLVKVNEGELRAITPLQNDKHALDIKLPSITLTDIGADKKGESITASISKILTKILNTASQTVVQNNLGDLKNVAKENLDNVVGDVKDKIKNIGIFGK